MRRALSAKERLYMRAAAGGLTAQQTARLYAVSTSTVTTALKDAKLKLGALNIAHAVTLAFHYGEIRVCDVMSDDAW